MKTANPSFSVVRIAVPTPFPVGPVNVYLIESDPPILVDVGPNTPEAYEALDRGLREHGYSFSDLGFILLTHGHIDHMGLLARILDESRAPAYAHPHAVARAAGFDSDGQTSHDFFTALMWEFGVPEEQIALSVSDQGHYHRYGARVEIQHVLRDGDHVAHLTACFVPGHSPSDTLFVDSEAKCAFVGDHILRLTNPVPLIRRPPPGQTRAKSLIEFTTSLQRTRQLNLRLCHPGHGSSIENPNQVIDKILNRNEERTRRVREILGDAELTPYDVCRALFPKMDIRYLNLGLASAIGHLEVLEEAKLVSSRHHCGVLYYSVISASE
ncbi:MAG: MBL fold metallo-hydrolase [Candidatus Hydrogenedentes bacterium]|nr:MBL fold metallo-hydrolase [Candidatus Hydrogenedentota bacterium]